MFLLVSSCSTKEQPAVKHTIKQQAITTFEEQEVESMKKVKKPSKHIYESYIFRKLSNSFDFRIQWDYIEDNFTYTSPYKITVIHKNNSSKTQLIISESNNIMYGSWNDVCSFETKINLTTNIYSDYPVYFAVGDFNFDTITDFIIVNNIPMSGTPTYNYYIQKSDSTFYLNELFTNQILFMPENMNPNSRSFNITSYSGCCFNEYKTYLIQENGRIKLIRHKKMKREKFLL
jgi:hypothetical protein